MIIKRCKGIDIINQKEQIFNLFEECIYSSFEFYDEKESFINSKIRDMIYFLEKNAVVFLAVDETEIVGFVWAYLIENGFTKRFHIAYLVVSETARKLGIGRLLVKEIEKEAKSQKIKGIELNVSITNKSVLEFYNKVGFYSERLLLVKEIKR